MWEIIQTTLLFMLSLILVNAASLHKLSKSAPIMIIE